MSRDANLKRLEAVLHKLSPNDAGFAHDLMRSIVRFGWTAGREKWVTTLAERGEAVKNLPAELPKTELGAFNKVYGLFAVAQQHLQHPKVRLQLASGEPLVLAIAGPQSSQPGVINVTDGRPYGMNKWYGRVANDGAWTRSHKIFPELAEVEAMLKRLGEAPAETASEYGRLTGHCCFCNLPLKDEKSTAAGYGPTCAENFGLGEARKHATPVLKAVAEGALA